MYTERSSRMKPFPFLWDGAEMWYCQCRERVWEIQGKGLTWDCGGKGWVYREPVHAGDPSGSVPEEEPSQDLAKPGHSRSWT